MCNQFLLCNLYYTYVLYIYIYNNKYTVNISSSWEYYCVELYNF